MRRLLNFKGNRLSAPWRRKKAQVPEEETHSEGYFVIEGPPTAYWSCNVYALDFSPNGRWLVLGCGGWYGHGGIAIIDIKTGKLCSMLRFSCLRNLPGELAPDFLDRERDLTISGIAFDASGKYLTATSWSYSLHRDPIFIFSFEENATGQEATPTITHRHTFRTQSRHAGKPTGVCFSEGQLFVRFHATASVRWPIRSWEIPEGLAVDTNVPFRHRTHARIIAAENYIEVDGERVKETQIVTEHSNGSDGDYGLVALHNGEYKFHRGADQPVTAILAFPQRHNQGPEQEIVTGDREGAIMLWLTNLNEDGEWDLLGTIRDKTTREATVEGAWSHYKPQSVVALCALEDGRFFSADASGEVLEWGRTLHGQGRNWKCLERRVLPRPGTPRCMAIHPRTSRRSKAILAVGVKAGYPPSRRTTTRRPGFVVCFEIYTGWFHVGHLLLMKKLLDSGRAYPRDDLVGAHGEIEALYNFTTLDSALFRMVVSFLIPKF